MARWFMPLTWASKCSSSGKYTAWWDILYVIYHSMQGSYLSRLYHLLVSLCSRDQGTQSRAGMFYSVLAVVWMFIFIATGWSFVSQLRHHSFQFLPQKDDCWGRHIPDPCCHVGKGWRIAQGAHFPPRHKEGGCRLIVIHFKSQIKVSLFLNPYHCNTRLSCNIVTTYARFKFSDVDLQVVYTPCIIYLLLCMYITNLKGTIRL